MDSNVDAGIVFNQPTTFGQRRDVARRCSAELKLTMPCLVDDMNNTVDQAYAAWPERLFIIDRDGLVAYSGSLGPFGFEPNDIKKWLRKNIGRPQRRTRTASAR